MTKFFGGMKTWVAVALLGMLSTPAFASHNGISDGQTHFGYHVELLSTMLSTGDFRLMALMDLCAREELLTQFFFTKTAMAAWSALLLTGLFYIMRWAIRLLMKQKLLSGIRKLATPVRLART